MESSNLGLCAALCVHDIHPTEIKRIKGLRTWVYEDTPECARVRHAYLDGSLEGSLLRYNAALRQFQMLIRER